MGSQSSGQGHDTAYAQIVAEHLGVPPERVRVRAGRHRPDRDRHRHRRLELDPLRRRVARGRRREARRQSQEARRRCARSERRRSRDRRRRRAGGRHRSRDIASPISPRGRRRSPTSSSLRRLHAAGATYPNGTHRGEVEIDPATGALEHRQLRRGRRLRRVAQSAAAGGPGARRHGAGHRPGADGADRLRPRLRASSSPPR